MRTDIDKAYEVLIRGGVILYPTDTVWGIGCDATNAEAVRRICQIKERSDSKSMLVLLDTSAKLDYYVEDVPDIAIDLIELSDKPLTIIYPKARNLPAELIADDGTIGIRITTEAFSRELCRKLKRPLVSTSANISGTPAPALFAEIDRKIIQSVDYVVDYRRDDTRPAKPSSIIRVGEGGLIKIIRE